MARILIVDDDLEFRLTLRKMLEKFSHEVIEAADGGEAIEACSQAAPELVITDIAMPDVDGLQTITMLKNQLPQLKIIAVSGLPRHSQACLNVAKQIGANEILEKPFSYEILLKTVKTVLES